jgi:hypothetical protein
VCESRSMRVMGGGSDGATEEGQLCWRESNPDTCACAARACVAVRARALSSIPSPTYMTAVCRHLRTSVASPGVGPRHGSFGFFGVYYLRLSSRSFHASYAIF